MPRWPSAEELSPRERDTMRYIFGFVQKNGVPPTRAQIQIGMGLASSNHTETRVAKLKRLGYLVHVPGALAFRVAKTPDGEPALMVLWPLDGALPERMMSIKEAERALDNLKHSNQENADA
jgi:SOS-response transcriptional repressor LexA